MLTYNQEYYINEAIRSVMLQKTDFPFELVIGNDASTDGTGELCSEWQKKHPQQIVLFNREQNLGLQQNFIQTYAHCQGEYIAICEGDDYWTDKHKLQRQVDFLDTNPDYSTCFHRVINYFEDRGTKSLSNGGQKTSTDILDLAASNYISNVSAIFRHGLFGELPEWFAQVSTYDYAIHLLNAQYGKIYYMKRPMAVYRQHGRAIWSEAGRDKKLFISMQIRELLMDYFHTNPPVYSKLLHAHTQTALALIRYYKSQQLNKEVERIEAVIMSYHPEWTLEQVRQMEVIKNPTMKDRFHNGIRRFLKGGRELVSHLIPLPKISAQ